MGFLIYSIIGWIWETIYCSIIAKKFVYRGFLLGPYCPVYGIGVSIVLLLAPKGNESILSLYFNVIVIVTIVEFVASFLLEKCFKLTLWDYKEVPFNIEGRVAVPVSLFWGIGCILLIKVVNPIVVDLIDIYIKTTHGIGVWFLMAIFAFDIASTVSFSLKDKGLIEKALNNNAENQEIKAYRLTRLFKRNERPNRQRLKDFILSRTEKRWHVKHLERLIRNYPHIDFIKKSKHKG
jgi:uncharacterized membrane protein